VSAPIFNLIGREFNPRRRLQSLKDDNTLSCEVEKPKMSLRTEDCAFRLIERAGSILHAHGLKQEAEEIHQKASVEGYDFYYVLRLLKQYMEI
jgi:hypothetical protein